MSNPIEALLQAVDALQHHFHCPYGNYSGDPKCNCGIARVKDAATVVRAWIAQPVLSDEELLAKFVEPLNCYWPDSGAIDGHAPDMLPELQAVERAVRAKLAVGTSE